MSILSFKTVLAAIALVAFLALLVAALVLKRQGEGGLAAVTGTSAVGLGITGLFKLLQELGN